ncbi:hypothetical protein GDO81_008705 [Engystomops pustulosus]|uniref:Uncharacterized protein n=1 Tax=Engystomops pustulosus TaxID=76066 RepID=A0AAV7CGP7_ENGPU|nr:hypothetical protein GDO81_008705 [Engystomops pustulosus]
MQTCPRSTEPAICHLTVTANDLTLVCPGKRDLSERAPSLSLRLHYMLLHFILDNLFMIFNCDCSSIFRFSLQWFLFQEYMLYH